MDELDELVSYIDYLASNNDYAGFVYYWQQQPIDWYDMPSLSDYDNRITLDLILYISEQLIVHDKLNWLNVIFEQIAPIHLAEDEVFLHPKTQLMLRLGPDDADFRRQLHSAIPQPDIMTMILQCKLIESTDIGQFISLNQDLIGAGDNLAVLIPLITDGQTEMIQPWDLQYTESQQTLLYNLLPIIGQHDARSRLEPYRSNIWQLDKLDAEFQDRLRTIVKDYPDGPRYMQWLKTEATKRGDLQLAWGPFNPMAKYSLLLGPEDTEEVINDLQPMFYPNLLPNHNPLAPVGEYDTFDHYCWQCYNGMSHLTWAVRRPLPKGGWYGYYCSWQCVVWSMSLLGSEADNLDEYELADRMQEIQIQYNHIVQMITNINQLYFDKAGIAELIPELTWPDNMCDK